MGNCVSFQLSCDQTVNAIVKCLCGEGYIRNLEKNLGALKREIENLRAVRDALQNRVAREMETPHRQRLEAVQVWLERVDSIDIEFKDVLNTSLDELQKSCFCGLCSKNVCSSYKYGKKVDLLLEEVKKLLSEGSYGDVTELTPTSGVEERPTQPTVGQEEMFEKAWNRLMKDGVKFMGLHGMGGVGKTTLFTKINNKFAELAGRFDVVMWVVVSKDAQISKLQEDIAKKLNLCDNKWRTKNESDKAAAIYTVLKKKKFVLMLDDVWEKVHLEVIGVPFPTRDNGCKVAFTTRSRDVCRRMGDHEPMEVKCLEWTEAWELFQHKVGDMTLSPDIVEQAKKVATKCRGLPLALNVIGETMASKTTIQEWEHAIDVLTRSAAEFSDMENEILPIIKYSYDNLVDEHIKLCFLYCALFPEDGEIEKEKLIDYWMCEGFLGEYQVIKRVTNKGYGTLGTLIRANLLMEVDTRKVVMHDVVREMALWIASDFGKQKEAFVVQANVKDWEAVRRMSLMNNDIENITCASKCSELATLFLQNNKKLKKLSGEFIQSMQKLVVLDLSNNFEFSELPEEISELASLQFLDLSYTDIERLPVGFQELKKLTHLNLAFTKRLCSISGISKLLSLRILKLMASKVHGDVSLVKELQLLEKATNLTGISTPFLKLERLHLGSLPKLESIYWSPLPFPFLEYIIAAECPKLRKLPLNATSVPRLEEFVISMIPREQKNEIEWEDEDTKNRFLPSFLKPFLAFIQTGLQD